MIAYDQQESRLTCEECGWIGPESETAVGDAFTDGHEFHCPECNWRFRGLIMFPLISEAFDGSESL